MSPADLRKLADPEEYPEYPSLWERDMQRGLRYAANEIERLLVLEKSLREVLHERQCILNNRIAVIRKIEAIVQETDDGEGVR